MKSNNYKDIYKIGNKLGDGGFAQVFEAIHIETNEKRALKIIDKKKIKENIKKAKFVGEPTEEDMKPYIDGFYNEIKNMQMMEGEDKENINTVKYYEFFDTKDEFIIVMECCDDNLMNIFVQKKFSFDSEKIYEIFSQLNYSFRMMVARKLVHRDLKLENILVKYENKDKNKEQYTVKLTDYGVSKVLLSLTKIFITQVGTMSFMAPEILQKNPSYNQEIDLWSLGIIIYILFFKEYPFKGENEQDLLNSINATKLKTTKDANLDDLINKLLIIDKTKRLDWQKYFNHPFFVKRDFRKYYEIDVKNDKLGEGGFGAVYRITHKKTRQKRAIKVIDKGKIRSNYKAEHFSEPSEEDLKPYFEGLSREIENMVIIEGDNKENKNTVKFYEYFETDDEFCIVMELCDTSLSDLLAKRNNPYNCQEIFNILSQLNEAFKVMVSKKIVHRDLKLDNILVKFDKTDNKKYTLKLTDYGASKRLLTMTKRFATTVGTCNYMAPEILNEKSYKEKCDLWSLGIIIFNLFFKRFPYVGSNAAAVKNNIDSLRRNAITTTGNKILDDLINRLLIYDQNERISWNEYFEHNFFKQGINEINQVNGGGQIILKLKVRKIDIKEGDPKKIYFLENDYYLSNNKEIKFEEENDEIKNLDNTNTELYINQKANEFQKYFTPKEEGIYEIKLIFKNKMKDCSYMFRNCQNITYIDLSSFDSSNVTSMKYMFGRCMYLNEIVLKNLNTENVKDMSYMFNKNKQLKKIDFPSSFNTKNVIYMNAMFHCCDNLSEINFNSSFTTQKVVNMKMMFGKCDGLKKVNLENFNTENVEDMSFMFDKCHNLETISLSDNFKTKKVVSMGHMFSECYKIKDINLSSFTSEKINFISYMFSDCKEIRKIDLSKFFNNDEVDMTFMFKGCNNLENLDLSSLNISNDEKTKNMFDDLTNIQKIKVSKDSIEKCKILFKDIEDKFSSS